MSELKLGKLPDRTPVKITIAVNPDLNQALRDYAAIYRTEYGETESVVRIRGGPPCAERVEGEDDRF